MSAPKELDFDGWALLSARLLKRTKEERRAILRAAELDAATWERWDLHYNTLLSDDLSEDRQERPLRYGELCAAEMRRRKEEAAAPPVAAAAPVPAEPAEPGVVPLPVAASGTAPPVTAPPVALPSAWRAEPVVSAAASAERAIGGEATLDLPVSPLLAEMPFPDADGELRGPQVSWEQVTARAPVPPSSPGELDRTLEPVAPEAAGFSGPEPVLTLSQYASLFVDLRRTAPSRRVELLHRYRLAGEASYESLSAAYKERFARDPTLRDRWVALCSEYQAWLDAKGRSG